MENKFGLYCPRNIPGLAKQLKIFETIANDRKNPVNAQMPNKTNEFTKREHCYKCGSVDHKKSDCQAETKCFKCNKKGHISRHCVSNSGKKPGNIAQSNNRNMLKTFETFTNDRKNLFRAPLPNNANKFTKREHCYKCGSVDHKISDCQAETKCFKCNKKGHISRHCVSNSGKKPGNIARSNNRNMLKAAHVSCGSEVSIKQETEAGELQVPLTKYTMDIIGDEGSPRHMQE